jgi:hypothetical protein
LTAARTSTEQFKAKIAELEYHKRLEVAEENAVGTPRRFVVAHQFGRYWG